MEESLRRLKRVREPRMTTTNVGGAATGGGTSSATGISDDDKIRLQLYVDVSTYAKRMKDEFAVDIEEVAQLRSAVAEATEALADHRPSV